MRKAVFLTVSQSVSKSAPCTSSSARLTTPGPLTPTLIAQSRSPTPWKAPAYEGVVLYGVAEDDEFRAAERVLVLRQEGRLLYDRAHLLHRVHVDAGAARAEVDGGADAHPSRRAPSGTELMSFWSEAAVPFWTSAENPPMKLTPTSAAARSSVRAIST